jgi:hypothetical protein
MLEGLDMGVLNLGDVKLPGTGYLSLFGFQIPVLAGLEAACLMGDGVARAAKNYAPGKADFTVVGAPVAGAGFLTLGAAGYIDTGVTEVAEMTTINVYRVPNPVAANAGIVGNWVNSASGGIAVWTSSNTSFSASAGKAGAVDVMNLAQASGTFHAIAVRARTGAASDFSDLATGTKGLSAGTGVRTVDATRKMRIGALYNPGYQTPNDQVLSLIYNRALTDAELILSTPWLRKYCSAKSITI